MQLQFGFDDWVEEKALEVFNRAKKELNGWNSDSFIPIDRIARDIFHLDILPMPKKFLGEDIVAAIEAEVGGGTIYVRDEDSPESKRFSIAHEIGHYVCHFLPNANNIDQQTFFRSCFRPEVTIEYKFKQQTEELSKYTEEERAEKLKRAQQESEANRFAAELLMPAHLLRQYYEEFNGDIRRLAAACKVSFTAMSIRVNNLGLKLLHLNLSVEKLNRGLNTEQLKAVQTLKGPLLILAGAGTGKTKVITHRIVNLIALKKVNPRNILAVTFTNKAAGEMRQRVQTLLENANIGRSLWINTFHSFCLKILRREPKCLNYKPNFTIADEATQRNLIKGICNSFGIDKDELPAKDLLCEISNLKNKLITADLIGSHGDIDETLRDVYVEYQRRLMVLNQMDFDDILVNTILLFRSRPDLLEKYQARFQYILVDEYQDTNLVQFVLLKELARKHQNICVVGDDDQSIYGWRGAEIENFDRFKAQFNNVKIIALEQNYRSTQTILAAANEFVAGNANRLVQKCLWTENGNGEKIPFAIFENEEGESVSVAATIGNLLRKSINPAEIAIMYRTHAQSRAFEKELIRQEIPYQVVKGVPFKDRREIKDILAFLNFLQNQHDEENLLRMLEVKTLSQGIGDQTIKSLKALAAEAQITLWQAIATRSTELKVRPNISRSLEKLKEGLNSLISDCRELLPSRIIEAIISRVRYFDYLKSIGRRNEDEIDWEGRKENVEELIKIAHQFEETEGNDISIRGFLDHLVLYEHTDVSNDGAIQARVSLMTIHSAKGLEFEHVFLIGLEQGIFPLSRSEDKEEERRLFYVGITRAKKNLYFSHCRFRFDVKAKETKQMQASDFVKEIPKSLLADWPLNKRPLQKAESYEHQRLMNRRKTLAS